MSRPAPSSPEAPATPLPVRSMTGFAQARRQAAGAVITVTLKSVNHRFLDLAWQLPGEWDGLASALEAMVRAQLHRGHVWVRVAVEPAASGSGAAAPPGWNRNLVASYRRAHAEISAELGSSKPLEASEVLRVPGVWPGTAALPAEPPEAEIRAALRQALRDLHQVRETEGRRLMADILERCAVIERAGEELRARAGEANEANLRRLRQKLDALLGAAAAPERLLQEAALLADRSDVSEELTRLAAHALQLRHLLAAGGEVGKKLDFLAQEMNREANTLLSKTGAGSEAALRMTALGLDLKAEIEKIREQVQNLE